MALHLNKLLLATILNDQCGQLTALITPGIKTLGVSANVERSLGIVSVYDCSGLRMGIRIGVLETRM